MYATFITTRRVATFLRAAVFGVAAVLAACGGRSDPPPPTVVVAGIAPAITQQPASATVTVGATATFSVTASGDAPLAYQWQRAGSAIAGATDASYTTPATTLADSSAAFTVVVSNGVGSVTSDAATLTVSATAPVLTVTQQPASTSVVAGASASFTVAGTCSAGTLGVKWQRSNAGAAFVDVAGATAATLTFTTTTVDSGARFRAVLDCAGQSATPSSAATLTVTTPGTVTLSAVPLVGLSSGLAQTFEAYGIDQMPDGSFVFVTGRRVQRLSADLSSIAVVAGGASSGSADGPATTASFDTAEGVVHDAAGTLFVTDNHTIRRIATDGMVTTIAGLAGVSGTTDGTGSAARFNNAVGIAIGPDGDLYVADTQNHRIRRVTVAGVVTTYAGGAQGYAEGPAATAQLSQPNGVAVAANGDVIVTDYGNRRVRRIVRAGNVAGAVETLAGNGTATAPYPDGIGTAAVIPGSSGLVLRGNTVVLQDGAGLLRQIDLATRVVTTITGSRALGAGYADGPLNQARLGGGGVALAPNGGYVVTNSGLGGLMTVSAAGDVHTVHTARAFGVAEGGTGVLAQMPLALYQNNTVNIPQAVTVDPTGNIVLVEGLERDVRRISPSGVVTPVAGLVGSTGNGVDGTGSAAQFRIVGRSVTSSSAGVLYVADSYAVRRIGTDNAVTTLAGSLTVSGTADGSATTARFSGLVAGLAVGPNGDVFACDPGNHAVRRIDAAGNVTTYAGALGQTGTADGPIATARLTFPSSLAFAPDGSLLVADYGSIRRVAADGSSISTVYTVAGAAAAGKIVLAPDGSIYFGGDASNLFSSGLYRLAPGATTPTVIAPGDNLGPRLGSAPNISVNSIDDMALLGPHQLVVLTGGQMIVVTVP